MKKTLFIAVSLIVIGNLWMRTIYAEEEYYYNPNEPTTLVAYLYYDNSQLYVDKNFQQKYYLVNDDFKQQQILTSSYYVGEVVNQNNQILAQFKFDPTYNDPGFKSGSVIIELPYFAGAYKVNFFDKTHTLLASIRVNLQANDICNQDNVCDADHGENLSTCPNDCSYFPVAKLRPSETPSATPVDTEINVSNPPVSVQPTPSTTPPPSRSKWKIFLPLVIWFGLAAALGIGWFVVKRRRQMY